MGVVVKLTAAVIFFTLFHSGDAIQCYVCSSNTMIHCGRSDAPNNEFLRNSRNNETDVCYEITKIDRESKRKIIQRGILPKDANDPIARMCLAIDDGSGPRTRSIVPTDKPRNSSNRNPNTLSGQAWNNLQQSKILSKRSANNPNTLLKEESEGTSFRVRAAGYNCTTCTKSRCNWDQNSVDYIDMDNFVTANIDDELNVTNDYFKASTQVYSQDNVNSATRSWVYFSLHCFFVFISLRLI
ncbi:hypothetical protein L9F63_005761 [Diploptera punctata]|uniref:Protein sleepless n=1 Tax=Diploptera punctata TaxID=6984 RepID=A0AAD7ZCA5_DIPPU|nr:hypothetical protein L9F63_005761 [Diploptera punctata]